MVGEFEGLIKTSLFSVHQQMQAKLAAFAGWVVPMSFAGTVSEHRAVRDDVGVFDVSHLGNVFVTGQGAEHTVAVTFANDVTSLAPGRSQYSLCCDEDGGIVDDVLVYRLADDHFMVVPNAANTAAVRDRLQAAADDARVDDASTHLAILAVQGPRSLDVARQIFPRAVEGIAYREIREVDLGPSDAGWVARTGYTGEVGVELVLPGLDAPGVFRKLVEFGATPCGLGARDTLRLEMGYPLHGNDITAETDPFEARLDWAVKLDGRGFRGEEALRERRDKGPRRRLWGVVAEAKAIPRPGMAVLDVDTRERVGTVTSGSFSPTLDKGIGLAYVDDPLGPGSDVLVDIRGKPQPFAVVAPPFVDRDPRAEPR